MTKQRRRTVRKAEDLTRVSYRIPVRLDKTVEKLATEEGVSMSAMASKLMEAGAAYYDPSVSR
jgi:hypothetical protein